MREAKHGAARPRVLWVTVSDRAFFPGTVAAVNSIWHYHPGAAIAVVSSDVYNDGLSDGQVQLLRSAGVVVYASRDFARAGRVLGAWQLKAYAAADLSRDCDLLIGIDSDAVLCTSVQDVIDACLADGKLRGGRDGDGVDYGPAYAGYGFRVPARSDKYMSTSLYFAPLTPLNRTILAEWATCCDTAEFGPQDVKQYPGHGDQGVLNSVRFKHCGDDNVELLENSLFSQHWVYLKDIITFENGALVNRTVNQPQRAFHCGGTMKFWAAEHSAWLPAEGQNQTWSYAHWLLMLWFGRATDWGVDPAQWIDAASHHLWKDLAYYYHHVEALDPDGVRAKWDRMSDALLSRITEGIPRAMSIGSSMSQYVRLAKSLPERARVLEVGSFYGGSVVTLAVALLHRDLDVTSVESFMGDCNGTVDGWPLSSPNAFVQNVKVRFPHLNVRTYPLDSLNAVRKFPDAWFDMVFIDGNHSTPAVLEDIDRWLPKVKPGGILAGDDIGWDSVRLAVEERFGAAYENKDELWWIVRR